MSFDTRINPWDLPKFRGAIANKVGIEHEWFHNHNNETGGYHQRYPLIQYKIDTLAFTVEFAANISLPDYIGLGNGAGEGFGVVRRQQETSPRA